MEAKEGHGGSYAWKSILKGRGIIQTGAKWRVGNGDSIKVYGDNWLPIATPHGVHGPLLGSKCLEQLANREHKLV